MTPSADQAILEALADLTAALGEIGAPSMIIGGIAAIARGVPRQTIDIDATVWGEGLTTDGLLAVLGRHRITGRIPDASEFARQHQVLLLEHEPTGTPLEVTLAWLPFEKEALGRAERVDFGGVTVPVARPQDLIVFKAVAWRDRDRSDIERLLTLHAAAIDLDQVRSVLRQFAEVLEAPERMTEFEVIVRRALGQTGPG